MRSRWSPLVVLLHLLTVGSLAYDLYRLHRSCIAFDTYGGKKMELIKALLNVFFKIITDPSKAHWLLFIPTGPLWWKRPEASLHTLISCNNFLL